MHTVQRPFVLPQRSVEPVKRPMGASRGNQSIASKRRVDREWRRADKREVQ